MQQFEDVMPPQLSKKLPLKRVIDHHIELVPAIVLKPEPARWVDLGLGPVWV
jgi:hypothetical protein